MRGDILALAQDWLESEDFFGFDLVIMSMALHHVVDSIAVVAKLAERLKPDGTIVLLTASPEGQRRLKTMAVAAMNTLTATDTIISTRALTLYPLMASPRSTRMACSPQQNVAN